MKFILRHVLRHNIFLNQARTLFSRIASIRECLYACMCVCVCVCPPARLLITSGVIDPYDWSNKFYGFCIAVVVNIIAGRDVIVHTRRGN